MFRKSDTHIHFVGVGGIGMSGIAEVLLDLGYRVTGTDLADSETTRRLAALGATIHSGHAAQHVADADVVVVSSAVGRDNPEIVAARQRKIPVIQRAEMLAELMRLKQGVAIAGSHGKTTTTSLIASILHAAGLDPTVVIGGKVNALGSNARRGRGELLVAEADESDGSFLVLAPTFAVVTNIDAEHLDHYGTLEDVARAFVGFANRVPFYGLAVVCIDDANVARIVPQLGKRITTYGIHRTDADYVAAAVHHDGLITRFHVLVRGQDLGAFELRMPGIHNVGNALAAIAIADELEVPIEVTRQALAEVEGVQRRFTLRGEVDDVLVVDDYGHHPTEIKATLCGARTSFPARRIVAAVQPHRYSRLRDNFAEFVRCLDAADVVVVSEVYSAGEAPLPGISGEELAAQLQQHRPERQVVFERDIAAVPATLALLSRPGDLVLTLGAGNITRVGPQLVELLATPHVRQTGDHVAVADPGELPATGTLP
ncbi:MAG TPA: UDP-N-acetylmuramate--L-alanine ligase [Nannocystaceae bacterium]|nr:UDP-N-acetylmuramate--L-alanine ligase [Nannocystaceae bacterium]